LEGSVISAALGDEAKAARAMIMVASAGLFIPDTFQESVVRDHRVKSVYTLSKGFERVLAGYA
jgi:hypothetical protein